MVSARNLRTKLLEPVHHNPDTGPRPFAWELRHEKALAIGRGASGDNVGCPRLNPFAT
jgi:hypothetical protein